MAMVLRLQPGSRVLVLDGLGAAYEVVLETLSSKEAQGRVLKKQAAMNEPALSLTLQVCLTQREKFEWILQKGTELGVRSFMPVLSARTLEQDLKNVLSKYDRWQKILKEAAEQCERGKVPNLLPPENLKTALQLDPGGLKIILYEDEQHLSLKQALRSNKHAEHIYFLVGPEGGFAKDEVEEANQAGFLSVSLGSRILRMETAAITAAALVMYEFDEMGVPSDQAVG